MMNRQIKPYPLRLQQEVSEWIKMRARSQDRSINAEINRLLRKIKEEESKKLCKS